jgi:hypothetical protein
MADLDISGKLKNRFFLLTTIKFLLIICLRLRMMGSLIIFVSICILLILSNQINGQQMQLIAGHVVSSII